MTAGSSVAASTPATSSSAAELVGSAAMTRLDEADDKSIGRHNVLTDWRCVVVETTGFRRL